MIEKYCKLCMTNLPRDLGVAIYKQILNSPVPDRERMRAESRRLVRENVMIREREIAQDAQSDWTTTVKAERLDALVEAFAGLVRDGLLTKAEAAKRVGLSETEFVRRSAIIAGKKQEE